MQQKVFDDAGVRAAMRAYLDAADRLDEAAALGIDPREVLDLAEGKTMAGLVLRKALQDAGWTAPLKAQEPA
jgi:hypothetical protein